MADAYADQLLRAERLAFQLLQRAAAGELTDYSVEGQSESVSAALSAARDFLKEFLELERRRHVSDNSTPLGGW